MDEFRFSATDITTLTDGFVDNKSVNNWNNGDAWFSQLQSVPLGVRRKYSRINAIEAGLAHGMMVAGITRRDVKKYLTLMAANNSSGGYVDELPARLERRPAFGVGSQGWLWLLTFEESNGERELDGIMEITADRIAEHLGDNACAAVIIPVSAIVARVDAIDAMRQAG